MDETHVPSFQRRRQAPAEQLSVRLVLLLDHRARLVRLIPLSIVAVRVGEMCSQYQKPLNLMTALRDPIEHFPGKTLPHVLSEMSGSDRPPFR
jgi:hypothetical protein